MSQNAQELSDKTKLLLSKLLARTTDQGFTEAEAAEAADKVAAILAQHNMTISMLELSNPEAGEKRAKTSRVGNAMYEHQRDLMGAIVGTNYCIHWVIKMRKMRLGGTKVGSVKSFRVAGRETNVIAVFNLFDYLNSTIERLCPWRGREQMSRASMSWKAGCAERLTARLWSRYYELQAASNAAAEKQREAQEAARRADPNAGTALVLSLGNVEDLERRANYVFIWGEETARRWLDGPTAEEKARAEEERRLEEELEAAETPAEKRKREEKARKQQERARARHQRESERRDAKTDWDAYRQGKMAADNIGLDLQIGGRGPAPGPAAPGTKRIS